nr:copia protein [Tanacetum cinerariifolium]
MSAMGELTIFLGLQVKQFPDGIFISQDKHPMLLVVQVFLLVVLVHADGLVLTGSCIIPTGSYSFMLIGLVPTGRYVVLAGSVWILLLLK